MMINSHSTDMTELLELFQRLGVVSNGHFLLSSGQHSDEYWEKFRLLEWPRVTEQLCHSIAERHYDQSIAAVVGPTTGGALLAQEVARQLGTRCLLAEPVIGGGRELRRGFVLHAGEQHLEHVLADAGVIGRRRGGRRRNLFSISSQRTTSRGGCTSWARGGSPTPT